MEAAPGQSSVPPRRSREPILLMRCELWKYDKTVSKFVVKIPAAVYEALRPYEHVPMVVIYSQGPARIGKSTYNNYIVAWVARAADCPVDAVDSIDDSSEIRFAGFPGITSTDTPSMGASETIAGAQVLNAFGVSHGSETFTRGADACFMLLPAGSFGSPTRLLVLVVDCEGDGAENPEYHAKSMLPGVIFCGRGAVLVTDTAKGLRQQVIDNLSHVAEAAKIYGMGMIKAAEEDGAGAAGAAGAARAGGGSDPLAGSTLGAAVMLCKNYNLERTETLDETERKTFGEENATFDDAAGNRNTKRSSLKAVFRQCALAHTRPPNGESRPWDCKSMVSDLRGMLKRVVLPLLQDHKPRCLFGSPHLPLTAGTFVDMLPAVVQQSNEKELSVPSLLEAMVSAGVQRAIEAGRGAKHAACLVAGDASIELPGLSMGGLVQCTAAASEIVTGTAEAEADKTPVCLGTKPLKDALEALDKETKEAIRPMLVQRLSSDYRYAAECGRVLVHLLAECESKSSWAEPERLEKELKDGCPESLEGTTADRLRVLRGQVEARKDAVDKKLAEKPSDLSACILGGVVRTVRPMAESAMLAVGGGSSIPGASAGGGEGATGGASSGSAAAEALRRAVQAALAAQQGGAPGTDGPSSGAGAGTGTATGGASAPRPGPEPGSDVSRTEIEIRLQKVLKSIAATAPEGSMRAVADLLAAIGLQDRGHGAAGASDPALSRIVDSSLQQLQCKYEQLRGLAVQQLAGIQFEIQRLAGEQQRKELEKQGEAMREQLKAAYARMEQDAERHREQMQAIRDQMKEDRERQDREMQRMQMMQQEAIAAAQDKGGSDFAAFVGGAASIIRTVVAAKTGGLA